MPVTPTATVKLKPPPALEDLLCVAMLFCALSKMTSRAAVMVVLVVDVMLEPRTFTSVARAVTLTMPPAIALPTTALS